MSTNNYNYGYNGASNSPDGKKNNDWVPWAIIVTLFAVGIWPVALILLFTKLSDSSGKKKTKDQFPPLHNTAAKTAQEAADGVERARAAAARAAEHARARTQQAAEQVKEETWQTVEQSKEQTRQAVEQAKEQTRQAVEQAKEQTRQAVEQAKELTRQAVEQAKADAKKDSRAKSAAKKMTKTPEMKSSTAKWMKVGGVLLLAYALMADVWGSLDMMFWSGDWIRLYLADTLRYASFAVAGVGLFINGLRMDRQAKRFQKYMAVIGNLEAVSLQQLSRTLGYSASTVEKDLLKMIDKGFFGASAYLNMELGYFFRSGEADANLAREQEANSAAAPQETEEGYSGILRNIRRANDRIADPTLSAKIVRLEMIAAKIFKAVEEDPKKRSRIDTFLNYYLPTTQKLLDSYAEFESTGIEGENLRQAKERIEATMDTIVAGFEHQLDELYRADFMDVDSDIRVMETMLGRDTSSAAKDFGLGQSPKPASRITDIDLGGSAAQQED